MSKYDKDTKFYWLQLKEDFFDEDSISWLEEQKNGEKYSLFYLKLCLKALKTKGILIRKVGRLLIPYDKEKLAEITKTDVDTVIIAMELLQKIGLIKILENGEIYLTQLENLIGQKSVGAFKKQQQRFLLKGGQGVDNCPPEIELELELEIELEQEMKKVVVFYEENIGMIVPNTYEVLEEYIKEGFSSEMIIYAMELSIKQNKRNLAYIEGIIRNWKLNNTKTLIEAKQENEKHIENKNSVKKEVQYNTDFSEYDEYMDRGDISG